MCGIFAILNNYKSATKSIVYDETYINTQFMKSRGRGPDNSEFLKIDNDLSLGFHRLSINGLNNLSNQPIIIDGITLICNGEIYNYKELFNLMEITPKTDSDCEIIIHLYLKYGIEHTLKNLDGVFAFVLYDSANSAIYIARDPFGVRPLYILNPVNPLLDNGGMYILGSELKNLSDFYDTMPEKNRYTVSQFKPGSYSKLVYDNMNNLTNQNCSVYQNYLNGPNNSNIPFFIYNFFNLFKPFRNKTEKKWIMEKEYINYHKIGDNLIQDGSLTDYISNIQCYLKNAVLKRVNNTERPIACLLSGGLDSSLITALVCEMYKQKYPNTSGINTYSIGMAGSADLSYARIVADYLGTNHTEILVSEQEFIRAIPRVITAIESYDTTTVRASIGNYLLGEYISKHSDDKVIFNGDGSDELTGGYLYFHACKDPLEFDKEVNRLLKDIHMFDVLRSDKSISTHGLEPRTPFLDRSWVNYYLSIPLHLRVHTTYNKIEKWLLRTAFSEQYYMKNNGMPLLPPEILWRSKEAFSDGVVKNNRSIVEIINESTLIDDYLNKASFYGKYAGKEVAEPHNIPKTKEQMYYREIFAKQFGDLSGILPYFWMPKYVDATDPSARTLQLYNINKNENNEGYATEGYC